VTTGTKPSPAGGNNVERADRSPAHVTNFPLTGINVERAALSASHPTNFPIHATISFRVGAGWASRETSCRSEG
jgi:hypothetical protein